MTETDINIKDITPILPNELFKFIQAEFNDILKKICLDNNLNYTDIISRYSPDIYKMGNKYGLKKRNRRILPSELQCMGRKLDGEQCTRGRRDNSDYCKSHEKKLAYGRIDEPFKCKEVHKRGRKKNNLNNDYICTHMEVIDGKNYLVDNKNFVYTFNINNPEFLGIYDNVSSSIKPLTVNN